MVMHWSVSNGHEDSPGDVEVELGALACAAQGILGLSLLGHVADRSDPANGRAARVADRRTARRPGGIGAVLPLHPVLDLVGRFILQVALDCCHDPVAVVRMDGCRPTRKVRGNWSWP